MWKAITSFFPGGEPSTGKPAGTFTNVSATAAGLPAQAAPLLKNVKNKKANTKSVSSGSKFQLFSSNLKQGVNYADPSSEEVYNLKISKPKFNAGDANPFFVNLPAPKYKVLISDDPETLPSEEITNSTLRFYGSSAENVLKKAKTYKTSAKSKHNTLFEKAKKDYRNRGTQKALGEAKTRTNLLAKRMAQENVFRTKIQKYSKDLNDYLLQLDFAKKKIIPATAFKKSEIMTNERQKREINRIEPLIKVVVENLEGLQAEIAKVSGLSPDIQTSLEEVLGQGKKAVQIVASVPVVSTGNVVLETRPENRSVLAKAAAGTGTQGAATGTQGAATGTQGATASTQGATAASSPKPSSTSGIKSGFASSLAAARLKGTLAKGSPASAAPAGAAGTGAGAPGAGAGAAGTGAGTGAGAGAAGVPPPIKKPNESSSAKGINPNLSPAVNSPVETPPPVRTGGSRKRRNQQKKRKARTAKRRAGKSRKY